MSMKHLILLQYKYNSESNEILSAIKSIERHCKFDFELFLLGEGTPLRTDIPVIEGDKNEYKNCRAQHIRVANDLLLACYKFQNQYKDFLLTSDDMFFINDISWPELCINKFNGEKILGNQYTPPTFWCRAKWRTGQFLKKQNLPTVDFTTHAPAVYNIQNLKNIINTYKLTTPPNDYTIEDLYGNIFVRYMEPIEQWRKRFENSVENVSCFQKAKDNGIKFINFAEINNINNYLQYIDIL